MKVCQLLQLIPDLCLSFTPYLFHKSQAYVQKPGAHTQLDVCCLLLSRDRTDA